MRGLCIIKIISVFFLVITCTQINAQFAKPQFEHISIEGVLLNVAQQGSEDRYNVDCMWQDSKGYLWFGTWDGLNKYDGYTFTTYKHSPHDTSSLIQNTIFTIWEDADKIIWLGTAESGISKFDRFTGMFTQYKPNPDPTSFVPPLRAVSAINEDKEGIMWVGNFLGELRRFNKHTGLFSARTYYFEPQFEPEKNKTKEVIYSKGHACINCIYKDHNGTLWVGTNAGLHKLVINHALKNDDSISFIHYLYNATDEGSISNNAVTSIFEDHTKTLWIGTDGGGLNRFDQAKNKFIHYQHNPADPNSISNNAIARQDIAEDKAGNLWIGTFNGLNKLDASRKEFISYYNDPLNPTSLSNNFIESLLIDRSGILWVGSHWKGLDKYDPQQKPFKLYAHSDDNNSLSNNLVTSITGNNKETIWISTAGGGINALNKRTGKFTFYRHDAKNTKSLDDDIVNTLIKDRQGNLWVRCQDLLSKLDTATNSFIHYSRDTPVFRSLVKEHLTAIYFDRKNRLWLGTHSGIKCLDLQTNSVAFYRYNPKDSTSLSDNAVYVFFEDNDGYLWIGHGSVGLSRLDIRTGKFTHYLPDVNNNKALSTCIVNCIYQDKKNNIWFGTLGGGLCMFNKENKNFITYTEQQGLADNTIISILEYGNNDLWLGTSKGLSKFSLSDFSFTNYDYNDGLQGNVFSEACYKDAYDGTLYFGGMHGFNAFHPEQLKPNSYIPPVVITGFTLFNKPVPGKNEAKEITLRHDENFFSFQFAALNFSNTQKNQYEYMLEGVDKNWVKSGTRREAGYTDITPGDYTFHVKAANNDGIWNQQGISVHLIILPPWWRTYWAYGIYTLCLAAVIVLLFRMQRNRLTKRQYERIREVQLADIKRELELEKSEQERKEAEFKKRLVELTQTALRSQINPHFIFNCLNSIKLYAEQNNVNAASEYLTKFSKLIRQVLENSRSEKITLTEEFEVLRLSIEMEVMRFKEKLQYSILIDGNVEADFIEIPPLLLQPYVENAIWHGLMPKEEGGMVEIKAVMKSETTLLITIRDNGIGRSKAAEEKNKSGTGHKSFGMKITSERMELMNQMYNTISRINIDDLKDDAGVATGTLVTLQIEV